MKESSMRQDTLKDANFRVAESVTYLVMYR